MAALNPSISPVGHSHSNHTHSHDNGQGHVHNHGPTDYNLAFAIGVSLNIAFVVMEVIYGLRANSVALVADGGHNFSDVLGLLLAWMAALLARRLPTPRRTYGMRRSSILAALANSIFLLVTVGGIAWEAIHRLGHPDPIATDTVIWVATLGIVINAATALLFFSGRKTDLNIRGAYLHMAADAAVSLGVVLAGFAISATGWLWLDPVVSLVIVAIITFGTWGLLRESMNLALDAVPAGIDLAQVEAYLCALPGVLEVHDLHVWGMSTTDVALTAHVVRPEQGDDDSMLLSACRELRARFGIGHATLQLERGHGPHSCDLRPEDVI